MIYKLIGAKFVSIVKKMWLTRAFMEIACASNYICVQSSSFNVHIYVYYVIYFHFRWQVQEKESLDVRKYINGQNSKVMAWKTLLRRAEGCPINWPFGYLDVNIITAMDYGTPCSWAYRSNCVEWRQFASTFFLHFSYYIYLSHSYIFCHVEPWLYFMFWRKTGQCVFLVVIVS